MLQNLKYIICGTVSYVDLEVPACYCHNSRYVTSQAQSAYFLTAVIILEPRRVSVI
jgi:hypothetical protein